MPNTDLHFPYKALERDGYRCMVTQLVDLDYCGLEPTDTEESGTEELDPEELDPEEPDIEEQAEPRFRFMNTNARHIIPLQPVQDPDSSNSALNFILSFCSLSFDEFNNASHSLANIMTLNCLIGPFITRLHAWFDAVPDANNTYYAQSWNSNMLYDMPPRVTFSTKTSFPLPDPRYLKIHAAVCRVFQWSGACTRAAVKGHKRRREER